MTDDEVLAALRRSEKHLAAAQRITHCGSWELDLANLDDVDRNPLRWSDEVFRIFGYEPGAIDVTNENFFAAVHPEDRDRIRAAVRTAIENGTPYSIDHRVIRPDGSIRIVHEASEIQYDAHGAPQLMIGTVQDVTEQRETEAQLVFADRMASVGTLAAGVAHEINNPLAAVVANLELLSRAQLTGEHADFVADARDGAERVRAIVRDLMIFSRADDARRAHVAVATVLDSALRLASHELKHRARVVRDYADVPLVHANESRLAQVFLNLVRNAVYAIPDGAPDRNELRVACTTDASGRVVVTVADTGCGIPIELRGRVFAPFFTTKPPGAGTGLGLSISQRIVSDLGGTIDFDSTVGAGTTFRVALPAASDADPPRPHRAPTMPLGLGVRHRVLVVDDEPAIVTALARVLHDFEVVAFSSPRLALASIRDGARYDAILCDVMMPGLTCDEVYREIVASAPDLTPRMVAMTGGAYTAGAREFLATTGLPRVDKPFDEDMLRATLARVIR